MAAFMRKYNPSLRTDQFSQYQTSVHGKLLAKGDTKVAVCIDCHGVHDLRPASDPRSKVHPLNIAQTCARCHADAAYMKGYGIPTDQFAKYSTSVHHEAMVVRGDSERSDLHDLPRKSWRGSAGSRLGQECLLELPRLSGADV